MLRQVTAAQVCRTVTQVLRSTTEPVVVAAEETEIPLREHHQQAHMAAAVQEHQQERPTQQEPGMVAS